MTDGEIEGAGESRAGRRPTITPLPMGRPRRREGEAQFSSWERLFSLTTHTLCFNNTASVPGYNLHVTPMSSSYAQ